MFWPFRNKALAVRLEGARVFLRAPRHGDTRAWVALRRESRDFLQPWEPTWPPDAISRAAFIRRRAQIMADWRHDTGRGFLIFRREDGVMLGGITLTNIRRGVADAASMGYWIGAPHVRQGHMTEAVTCVLDFAFGELGLHRVEAACLPDNEASRALLLKTGFSEEGMARDYLKIDGRWRDHRTFAVLRDDLR